MDMLSGYSINAPDVVAEGINPMARWWCSTSPTVTIIAFAVLPAHCGHGLLPE